MGCCVIDGPLNEMVVCESKGDKKKVGKDVIVGRCRRQHGFHAEKVTKVKMRMKKKKEKKRKKRKIKKKDENY